MSRPANVHRVTPIDLPARTRARLAAQRRIDRTAAWLVDRRHFRAATWLWRAFRMI